MWGSFLKFKIYWGYTMNKTLLMISSLVLGVCSTSYAYTPNLVLLASTSNAEYYIDKNSIRNINKNIKESVIYEKFRKPVSVDGYDNYRSDIKYHHFNCKNGTAAVYKGTYYKGLTSNSGNLGSFNDAYYTNGDTGDRVSDLSILEFFSLSELKNSYSYTRITPAFVQAFNATCRK